MPESKRSKAHLISLPRDLMERLEERGKMSAQSAGELSRQVLLCFLDGLVMPPRVIERPVEWKDREPAAVAPAPPPAPYPVVATPPLRSVPTQGSTYTPPLPVASGPAGFPDIDFDAPGSDALAAAQELLGKVKS